jgi:hypothetical protein
MFFFFQGISYYHNHDHGEKNKIYWGSLCSCHHMTFLFFSFNGSQYLNMYSGQRWGHEFMKC